MTPGWIARRNVLTDAGLPATPHERAIPATIWRAVVALYSQEGSVAAQVGRALRPYVDFIQATDVRALRNLANEVACSVLVDPRSGAVGELDCAAVLRRHHPFHPVVTISHTDVIGVRGFCKAPRDEVILLRDLDRELGPAVSRACLAGILERLAQAVQVEKCVSPKLRFALCLACRARPPIRSVKELVAQVRCQPRTLQHHWRNAVSSVCVLRLHDFLAWLLLLHACAARLSAGNWVAVGAEVGVSVQTLARIARTLLCLSLRDLAAVGPGVAFPLFRRELVRAFPNVVGALRDPT